MKAKITLLFIFLLLSGCGGGSGGGSTPPGNTLGKITVSDSSLSIINVSFEPEASTSGTTLDNGLYTSLFLVNKNISSFIDSESHNLFIKFTQDGVPSAIKYTSKPSGEASPYEYVAFCDRGEDCSGFSVNTATQTIVLKDALLTNILLDPTDTSGNIQLNGVVNYEL